jgi:glutamyl-tRNA reductase
MRHLFLSTCNRTELYCEIDDLQYVENISDWLLKTKRSVTEDFPRIYTAIQIALLLDTH